MIRLLTQLRLIFKTITRPFDDQGKRFENIYKQGKWCPSTRYRDDDADKDQYDEDCLHLNIWVPLTAIKNKDRIHLFLDILTHMIS